MISAYRIRVIFSLPQRQLIDMLFALHIRFEQGIACIVEANLYQPILTRLLYYL